MSCGVLSLFYVVAAFVVTARRAHAVWYGGVTARADNNSGNGYVVVGAAHAFFGFGFFILLNSHGFLLALSFPIRWGKGLFFNDQTTQGRKTGVAFQTSAVTRFMVFVAATGGA